MSADCKWFVLYCAKDDSFSVEDEDNVLLADTSSVKVGDLVRFKATGGKKIYEGVVKGVGDDEDEMLKLRDKLNKNRERLNMSFHEDRPRRARLAANDVIKSAVASLTNKKGVKDIAKMTVAEKLPRNGKKAQVATSSTLSEDETDDDLADDADDCDDDNKNEMSESSEHEQDEGKKLAVVCGKPRESDSSEEDSGGEMTMTPEERELYEKLTRKLQKTQKRKDKKNDEAVKRLKATPTSASEVIRAKKQRNGKGAEVQEGNSEKQDERYDVQSVPMSPPVTPHASGTSSPGTSNEMTPKRAKRTRKSRGRLPFVKTSFHGKMFVYSKDDPKVEELTKNSNVFVCSTKLTAVKNSSTSVTAVARKLLHVIFTAEARHACSVGGNKSTGTGARLVPRPPLDERGVEAIINFAISRGKKKGYDVVPISSIKSAMNSKLCEDRHTQRLNEAAAAVELNAAVEKTEKEGKEKNNEEEKEKNDEKKNEKSDEKVEEEKNNEKEEEKDDGKGEENSEEEKN